VGRGAIDGQHVLTTPSARRVALSPGRHWLKFTNPAYREVSQVARARRETDVIEIDLEAGARATTVPPPGSRGAAP
jgi:hypothetical protein